MKCGNCHKDHETVAEVRACYGPVITSAPMTRGENGKRGQYELLQILLAERDMTPLPPYDEAKFLLNKKQASEMIRHLIDAVPKSDASKPAPESYPDVPDGFYAVKSATGNNDLDFFKVDRPVSGKWNGYTFVKRVIGGRPAERVRGKTAMEALQAIVDLGPGNAALLYAQELGQCYKCNKHLTDELSRQLGIGPTCRSMLCQPLRECQRSARYGNAPSSCLHTGCRTPSGSWC